MGVMKKIVVLSFCFFVLTGCKTIKDTSNVSLLKNTRDSISHTVNESIQTERIEITADSAMIRALLECDANGKVLMRELEIIRGQRIKPEFILKNNHVTVPIHVDSMSIYHLFRTRYERDYRFSQREDKAVKTVETIVYKTSLKSIVTSFVVGLVTGILSLIILSLIIKRI